MKCHASYIARVAFIIYIIHVYCCKGVWKWYLQYMNSCQLFPFMINRTIIWSTMAFFYVDTFQEELWCGSEENFWENLSCCGNDNLFMFTQLMHVLITLFGRRKCTFCSKFVDVSEITNYRVKWCNYPVEYTNCCIQK